MESNFRYASVKSNSGDLLKSRFGTRQRFVNDLVEAASYHLAITLYCQALWAAGRRNDTAVLQATSGGRNFTTQVLQQLAGLLTSVSRSEFEKNLVKVGRGVQPLLERTLRACKNEAYAAEARARACNLSEDLMFAGINLDKKAFHDFRTQVGNGNERERATVERILRSFELAHAMLAGSLMSPEKTQELLPGLSEDAERARHHLRVVVLRYVRETSSKLFAHLQTSIEGLVGAHAEFEAVRSTINAEMRSIIHAARDQFRAEFSTEKLSEEELEALQRIAKLLQDRVEKKRIGEERATRRRTAQN